MVVTGYGRHQKLPNRTRSYAPRNAPPKPPQPQLQRLIIIDGFNVMRGFQNLIHGLQNPCDSRMNAIVLLPIIRSFIKYGFRVRIALKRLPHAFEVFHMYILDELNKMQMLLYPEKNFLEADDEIMLRIAAQHGAIIISNDAFSNHHQFKAIAKNNTIKYKRERNHNFSLKELERRLTFEYKFNMDGRNNDLYCSQQNYDYHKVKESYHIFWPLTKKDKKDMDFLCEYVHRGICLQMGITSSTDTKFLDDKDESYPKKLEDFKNQNY